MSRKSFDDYLIQCPFFKDADKARISCEGVQDGITVSLGFSNSNDKRVYLARHCCRRYTHCPYYKIVDSSYSEFGERK